MSDQLLLKIRGVQAEISQHRNAYIKNEAQTKQALITPVLKSLGWSEYRSANSHLHMEFGDGPEKVDFALIQNKKPVILIEAKELSDRLGKKAIRQVFDYCFHENVPTAVLTNGSEWRFYSPLLNSIRDFEARCFLSINVEREEANRLVEQLSNLHSKRTNQLGEFANYHWLLNTWDSKLNKEELIKPLTKPIRDSLPRELKIPLNDVREFIKTMLSERAKKQSPPPPATAPKALKPPTTPKPEKAIELQGELIPAEHLYQILSEAANWLIRQGKLRKEDSPLRLATMPDFKCLINTEAIHPPSAKHLRGRKTNFFKKLQNGLYIDTGSLALSRQHLVNQTRELLEHCGYNPDILKIIGHSLETPRRPKQTPRPEPQYALPDTGRAVILNREHFPIKYAYEILVQTVEWLIKRNKLHREVCPIFPGEKSKNRYLIHIEPKHQRGHPFNRPKQLTNGLYLEVNYSQPESIRLAQSLLEHYGYPPATLQLIGFDD